MASPMMIQASDIDVESDLDWQRQQAAVQRLTVGEVLEVIDEELAQEPDPTKHPAHGIVAYLLDQSNTPGTGMYDRYTRLAERAIARLVAERLADDGAWEGA